jgi:hypothetical protein
METYLHANCPYCANPDEPGLPVDRKLLDDIRCSDPNCTGHIVCLAPACHEEADSRAFYCQIHGTLSLFCRTCNSLHTTFKIAEKTSKPPRPRRTKSLDNLHVRATMSRSPLTLYGLPVHVKPTTNPPKE